MRIIKKIKKGSIKLRNNFKILKRIFSYAFHYKMSIFIIAITTIVGSLAGMIGTAFIQTVIDKYIGPLTKNYNVVLLNQFIYALGMLGLIYFLGSFSNYISRRLIVSVVAKTLCSIRKDLFEKMERFSLKYFDANKYGELMSLYTNDIEAIRFMLNEAITSYISSFIIIIFSFSMMFYYSWQLSMIVVIMIIITLFLVKDNIKKSSKYFTEQQDELAKLNGFAEEIMEGQKVVKVFCHEEQVKNDFKKINTKLCDVSTKARIFSTMLFPIIVNLLNLIYVLVAMIGAVFVAKSTLSVGVLVSFLIYIRAITDPIIDIADQMSSVFSALAGGKRIFRVIDGEEETDDGNIKIEKKDGELFFVDENDSKKFSKKFEGTVKFENVIFSYDGKVPVLKSINLEVKRGEKIALVGSTGAGKTTIISLLNRFYDVQKGEITVDGIDIKSIKKSDFRKIFSMVLQDTHLFTDTIMENVRYGRLDATDEEVIEATKLANADGFIRAMPNGYNTLLTSDATNLSQGERQLLSIARAILSNRQVLILDEATSSIDTRTESLIEEAINNLIKNKTVFIIAHRLSTVRNADKIVVLENGIVMEQGNHEELLKNKGRYYELYNGLVEME